MFRIVVKPGTILASGRINIVGTKRCFSVLTSRQKKNQLHADCTVFSRFPTRLFTSESSEVKETKEESKDEKKSTQVIRRIAQEDDDYYDDYEGGSGKTGYKKYFTYLLVSAISGIVLYASYSIAIELFGRSAPGHLYDETFEIVRVNDEVIFLIVRSLGVI